MGPRSFCRFVTEKRWESTVRIFLHISASRALNQGLPLDYFSDFLWISLSFRMTPRTRDAKGTDEDFRYLLTGKPLDQSKAFLLAVQVIDTFWFHFCLCDSCFLNTKSIWDHQILYDAMLFSTEIYIIARHQFVSQAELLLLSLLHCQHWIYGTLSFLTFHKPFEW